jgi:SAM-dependent methyltransferase
MENHYVQKKFGSKSSAEKWSFAGVYNPDINAGMPCYGDKHFRKKYVLEGVPVASAVGQTVLDLGCASGAFFPELINKGYEVTGVDSVPVMIEQANKLCKELEITVNLKLEDCAKLSFQDSSFNVCIAVGLIEHQMEDLTTLREVRRILKDDGILVITIRNFLCPYVRFDQLQGVIYRARKNFTTLLTGKEITKKKLSHGREHLPAAFKRRLRATGFEVTGQRYSHFYLFPPPLDRFFPDVHARLGKKMEILSSTKLGWLGSTCIFYARAVPHSR